MSEQAPPESPKTKPRFDRSDLISIIALITSLAALGATIYEANILKDQQEIMQAQQKSSVWPYIATTGSRDWSDEDKTLTLTYSIINKGIGPALVRDVTPVINGEKIDPNVSGSLNTAISAALPDDTSFAILQFPTEGIIGVKEEKPYFKVKISKLEGNLAKLTNIGLYMDICYCSIYDDCWIKSGSEEPIDSDCNLN